MRGKRSGLRGGDEKRYRAGGLWLRPVHRGVGPSLRCGAYRGDRCADLRGQHQAPVDADAGSWNDRHRLHAVLCSDDGRNHPRSEDRYDQLQAPRRHLWRRTLDRGHAQRDRETAEHPRAGHLRSDRERRPRRGDAVPRGRGTAHLGGLFHPGDRRSCDG